MKKNKIELDIDFIGGQGALTKDEANAVSTYIKKYRAKHLSSLRKKSGGRRKPATHKSKLTA